MASESIVAYDPERVCGIHVQDLEYHQGLAVRIYQPEGTGPFPVVRSQAGTTLISAPGNPVTPPMVYPVFLNPHWLINPGSLGTIDSGFNVL